MDKTWTKIFFLRDRFCHFHVYKNTGKWWVSWEWLTVGPMRHSEGHCFHGSILWSLLCRPWLQMHHLAAFIFTIFLLHFCTVGGSGDTSSITGTVDALKNLIAVLIACIRQWERLVFVLFTWYMKLGLRVWCPWVAYNSSCKVIFILIYSWVVYDYYLWNSCNFYNIVIHRSIICTAYILSVM